ncbi:hypothetical protein ACFY1L_16250 [Streptomyces sp. NPDC001663]|uniref:hypothetical protein n=1 Tax=Streptomyces sp. NPDC001663 TaxID=3364597 RepID=UPI00369B59C1
MRRPRIASLHVPTARATAAAPDRPAAQTLGRYYDQRPAWHHCGPGPQYPAALWCGTVTVPVDYTRPTVPTRHLKISRLRTARPGKRHGVLLSNPGGPGAAGLGNPVAMKEALPGT